MAGLVVLISGRGSNMQALVEAGLPVEQVISNEPAAAGLPYARACGIATRVVDHRQFADRRSFDAELARLVADCSPDGVLLAGFMRVLTPEFVATFSGRLLNIHPSLLPAFPGLRTHARALEAGVKLHGATVHFVTPALDSGPIVIQAAVPVFSRDDEAALAARVLAQEHRIYPRAARWLIEGKISIESGRVLVRGDPPQFVWPQA